MIILRPRGAFIDRVMSLDVPENLKAWNYDTVVHLVTKHEYEPGIFDYKAV